MEHGPDDPRTVAELDQQRAEVDRLANLIVHLEQRLAEGGISKSRRSAIVDRWLDSQLSEPNDECR